MTTASLKSLKVPPERQKWHNHTASLKTPLLFTNLHTLGVVSNRRASKSVKLSLGMSNGHHGQVHYFRRYQDAQISLHRHPMVSKTCLAHSDSSTSPLSVVITNPSEWASHWNTCLAQLLWVILQTGFEKEKSTRPKFPNLLVSSNRSLAGICIFYF